MSILKEIFTTEGRLNRLAYIKYMLILAVIAAVALFVTSCMATFLTGSHTSTLVNVITDTWTVVAIVGNFMLIIRRVHDLDKSSWFALIAIVPLVGLVFSIYLFFAPGTVGYNRYGPDPLTK